MVPPTPAEPDDDLDDVLDIEPTSRSARRRRDRRSRTGRAEPVRRWAGSGGDGTSWEEDVDDDRAKDRPGRSPVFWRARDSLYFEPLVALAIIVILLVSLFAYTSNWPPVYVVESNSMQHGSGDHLGVLNAGDIVLVQKASAGSIVTYVDGLHTGFSTYGLSGDVILYYPNGSTGATPIIHRAIIFFQYDSHNDTYNATGLAGLSCGAGSTHVYYTQGATSPCATDYLSFGDILYLYHVGGRTITIDFSEASYLGPHSGFLTLGDNNSVPDQLPPAPISTLVEPGWVIGVARGMIPWFGALKLLLDGNAGKVPTASWEFLGLTIAAVIFAAAGLHVLFQRRREARSRRRGRYEEDDEDEEPAPRSSRAGRSVRPWSAAPGPPDEAPAARPSRAAAPSAHEQRRRSHFVSSRDKRPPRRHDRDRRGPDDPEDSEPAS